MQKYNQLTVNFSAIYSNVKTILSRFKAGTRLMPMVKASAYGTEAFTLADFYHSVCGIDIVGVSHVHEGIALREKGFSAGIFVIGSSILDVVELVYYDFEVMVDNEGLCRALNEEALKQRKRVKVHLHLDTGMSRFGCRFEPALNLAENIVKLPGLLLEGLLTHFVAAESSHFDEVTKTQSYSLEKLLNVLRKKGIVPKWVHAANSAGALRLDLPFCNMVRIGLASFGIFSSENEKENLLLEPALSLESVILGINNCLQGESVGYSKHYTVQKKQEKIAVIPLGYFDGLHLHYSNKGYVLIHGKPAPMVGRICMDFMMVDITLIPEAAIGDPVLIFGKDKKGNSLPVELVSSWANTNVRELIVCLGPRIHRRFVYAQNPPEKLLLEPCESSCG